MRTQVRILVAALGCMAGAFHANTAAAADQARHRPPVEIIPSEIYDPLGLVSRHGQLVSLAKGFSFTEGPAADRHGNVFFTDQPNDKIYRWDAGTGKITLFLQGTGRANGMIFDREGRVIVDSRPIYNVILSREDVKDKPLTSLIQPLSEGLTIDSDILKERFDQVTPAFESILVKQDANPNDIALVEAHNLEFPELRVEQQPQRRYPADGMLAHVLGYVGEISPEQLKQQSYKDKGLKPGDIIGQSGIEQIYDDYLRGRDGYREVVVDSRGRIQDEIETVAPTPGRDLVTTIDLDLQRSAEEQLATSVTKRGVIVAMDPNNGEILALASNRVGRTTFSNTAVTEPFEP